MTRVRTIQVYLIAFLTFNKGTIRKNNKSTSFFEKTEKNVVLKSKKIIKLKLENKKYNIFWKSEKNIVKKINTLNLFLGEWQKIQQFWDIIKEIL